MVGLYCSMQSEEVVYIGGVRSLERLIGEMLDEEFMLLLDLFFILGFLVLSLPWGLRLRV